MATVWLEIVENDFAGFTTPAATLTIATALVLAAARRIDAVSASSRPGRKIRSS